jgi:hypothetical protein
MSYAYQWKRNGASISGATANAYTLVTADVGAMITATVTATNAAGSASATADPVGPVTGTDTTPNAFTFTDVTGAAISTIIESNAITVSGINAPATMTITGGQYQINGGSWASTSTTVVATNTVKVRGTSSASNSTAVNVVLTIGGVSDTFSITTVAAAGDTTPNPFTFTDATDVALSTLTESNAITVLGINAASTMTITGGEYQKNGGGAWVSTATTVVVNDTVKVRGTSSALNSTAVNVVLTIGGVSDTFTITTAAAAAIPAPTMAWTSANTVLNPVFTLTTFDAVVGDVLVLEVDNSSDFSSLHDSETDTLDSTEVAAGTITYSGFTTLTGGVTYYARVRLTRGAASVYSNTVTQTMFVDTTAPTLAAPLGSQIGSTTTASLGVTTNEANGTLYYVVTTSATPPTAAQVKAGQNNSGTAALYAGSQVIISAGAKTATATGITVGTRYAYYMHEDASANQSTVSASSSWTQAATTVFTFISGVTTANAGTGGGASGAINTTGAGLLILVSHYYFPATGFSVSDSKGGNTWTRLTSNAGTVTGCDIWYCVPTNVGTGHTASITGSNMYAAITFAAFANGAASPLDQQSGVSGGPSTTVTSSSITPLFSNELVIAAVSASVSGTTISSPTGGFTLVAPTVPPASGSNMGGGVAYLIQTTAAAAAPQWTLSGASEWSATMASFKVS